jgi:hypothetical protein
MGNKRAYLADNCVKDPYYATRCLPGFASLPHGEIKGQVAIDTG